MIAALNKMIGVSCLGKHVVGRKRHTTLNKLLESKMKLLEFDGYTWSLYENEGTYLFRTTCFVSAGEYEFLMELDPYEMTTYQQEGKGFLDKLAKK